MSTTDDTNAACRGSGSNDQLGQASEAPTLVERLRQRTQATEFRPNRRACDCPALWRPTNWEKDPLCQEAATALEVLQNDLNTALGMLAHWCVAVDVNGTQWDDWDESYKYAMYRDGPLRAMLDRAIAEARKLWG